MLRWKRCFRVWCFFSVPIVPTWVSHPRRRRRRRRLRSTGRYICCHSIQPSRSWWLLLDFWGGGGGERAQWMRESEKGNGRGKYVAGDTRKSRCVSLCYFKRAYLRSSVCARSQNRNTVFFVRIIVALFQQPDSWLIIYTQIIALCTLLVLFMLPYKVHITRT